MDSNRCLASLIEAAKQGGYWNKGWEEGMRLEVSAAADVKE